ncbi:hypothetical protein F4859DRAFT_514666 [Xylaria cf. heliscus]|nr:hypothetical protein F4859DRAFT_514666 [Xylaria cf. heliscus]
MPSIDPHKEEPFYGFLIGDDGMDYVAQAALSNPPAKGITLVGNRWSLIYHNTLKFLLCAFAVMDYRCADPNFSFYLAIAEEFGTSDTYLVHYLYDLLLKSRVRFLYQTKHINGVDTDTEGHPICIRPFTALAWLADVLLKMEYFVEDEQETPGDATILAFEFGSTTSSFFVHRTCCKLTSSMKHRPSSNEVVSASSPTTARLHGTIVLAKNITKTLVELNLFDGFKDVLTCLDMGNINGQVLVKKVAKAMIDADLVEVTARVNDILYRRMTDMSRSQAMKLTERMNEVQRPRADV